jgi:hypothetical protein
VSNVADAIALVSARNHYKARARVLEAEARQHRATGHPLTAKIYDYRARLAHRAAIAELLNPEVPPNA